MVNLIYEDSIYKFIGVTVLMGGWAAWMTGKACASSWSRYPTLFFYLFLLTAAVRFIHQAPFGGNMFSLHHFIVDLIYIQLVGLLSYRLKQASQIVGRYGWMFQKSGSLSWTARSRAD